MASEDIIAWPLPCYFLVICTNVRPLPTLWKTADESDRARKRESIGPCVGRLHLFASGLYYTVSASIEWYVSWWLDCDDTKKASD